MRLEITHVDGYEYNTSRHYEGEVVTADEFDALRARLAEVEAQMIEQANNSAEATTLHIEASGKLADAMRYLEKISNIEENTYYGVGPGESAHNLSAAKHFAREALAKLEANDD